MMNMGLLTAILLVVVSCLMTEVNAFAPSMLPMLVVQQQRGIDFVNMKSRLYSTSEGNNNSREQEIAALEEQLRRLKEDGEKETAVAMNEEFIAADDNSSAYLGRLTPDVATPLDEMLSESWKEQNDAVDSSDDGGIGSTLGKVAAGILLVAGLALASQVPVGQDDFSKYSYKEPAAPATSIDLGDLNPVKNVKDTVISTTQDE